jgi:hypothetical protein
VKNVKKRLRVLGAGGACLTALGVACAFAAPAVTTTACTTHQCDTNSTNFDSTVGDVRELAPGLYVWESSPMDGTWIDFPGMQSYYFQFPAGFQPLGLPAAYVATTPDPDDPEGGQGVYVPASGQLAELNGYNCCGFRITNDSCAEYFLYVSVLGTFVAAPAPPADDAGDAGADEAGDAGSGEAGD